MPCRRPRSEIRGICDDGVGRENARPQAGAERVCRRYSRVRPRLHLRRRAETIRFSVSDKSSARTGATGASGVGSIASGRPITGADRRRRNKNAASHAARQTASRIAQTGTGTGFRNQAQSALTSSAMLEAGQSTSQTATITLATTEIETPTIQALKLMAPTLLPAFAPLPAPPSDRRLLLKHCASLVPTQAPTR